MYQKTNSQLAENVRRLRKDNGWSKTKLAQTTGLHRNTINDIERGVCNPTIKIICKIADQLNTTPERLLMLPIRKRTRPRGPVDGMVKTDVEI